jgi:hypothetical protein
MKNNRWQVTEKKMPIQKLTTHPMSLRVDIPQQLGDRLLERQQHPFRPQAGV